jgi:RNA polymerase sigma factor (sigma-70 family)
MTDRFQQQAGDKFPVTRLSMVDAARGNDAGDRERAFDALFAAYWRPIYKYIRLRWNRPAEDAQDLTQGFCVELLERELLARYDPAKSRLRTYLRLCVDSFVMNQDKAAQRQKRGGNAVHIALDFNAAENELHGVAIDAASLHYPTSLEDFFEKEWIRSLFSAAVDDLRKEFEVRGKLTTFELFEEYDLDPTENTSYETLAERHHIPVTDVTNGLALARREFRRIALGHLRDVCGSDEEFQREALAIFGRQAR